MTHECDRCGKAFVYDSCAVPKYRVCECFDLVYQTVEPPLFFCPECERAFEKFMEVRNGGDQKA